MAKFKTAAPTHIDAVTGSTPTQQEADNLADQLESPAAAIEGEQGEIQGEQRGEQLDEAGEQGGEQVAQPAAEETASLGEGEQLAEQVEQVEPEQPETSTLAVANSAEWQMQVHLAKIREAEAECAEAEEEMEEYKSLVKAAKKKFDLRVERLRAICCQSPYLNSGKSQNSLENQRAHESPAGEATTDTTATTTAPLVDPDAWKSVLISKLDISEKLVEKLNEANVYDLGQLANFREQIALGREKWPKGIGEAKITAIEDAMTEWLTQNRDTGIFSQGGGVVAESSSAPADSRSNDITLPAEPSEVKEPVAKEEVTKPNEDWAAMDSFERCKFVERRAFELDTSSDDDSKIDDIEDAHWNIMLGKQTDGGYWEMGHKAFQNGEPIESAIDYPPSPAQDDWIRGWLVAHYQNELGPNMDGETGDEPTDIINESDDLEPTATSSSQFSTTTVLADIDDV